MSDDLSLPTAIPTQKGKLRRKLPLWKRGLFSLIVISLLLLVLEVMARYFTPWKPYLIDSWINTVAASGRGVSTATEVIHPYLGWTLNPETDPGMRQDDQQTPVNRWGLIDKRDAIQKRSANRVIIGILGGSVAQEFSFRGERRLTELLTADPRFAGREILIVHLAAAGYKQPQQLILLNYLYALGAEFDYVLNIDGFNDVVLSHCDNMRYGLHYTYPYYWHARLQDVVDPRETSISWQLFELRARRQAVAISTKNSLLRGSMLYCLLWKLRDMRLASQINDLAFEIVDNNTTAGRGYPISGPRMEFASDDDARTAIVDFWKHCSWQMSTLCASRNARYLHFLQPNQYVPDSKKLTPHELEYAFDPNGLIRTFVEANYPRMSREQPWFDEHGIQFTDLTQIFRDEDRTIYRDWCCHVNELGNDLIAEAVAAKILSLPADEETH